MRRVLLVFLFLFISATHAEDVPSNVMRWIGANQIPLKTTLAGNGLADLDPLKQIIGNTRIVAMGEATHGTREFFELKHRIFEFLVERLGFRIFAMEANFPEALEIDHYILTGEGDPEKALAALYNWTWNTQEVLDMVRWMRNYNADSAHSKKIRFYGFDMQAPSRSIDLCIRYIEKKQPEKADQLKNELSILLNPFTARITFEWDQQKKTELLSKTTKLIRAVDLLKNDTPEWRMVRQHARAAEQFSEMLIAMKMDFTVRDKLMAENVKWILEQEEPGSKVMLWAHNFHVSKIGTEGRKSMGYHLSQVFGKEMLVFGFMFYEGSFQAVEMPFETGRGLRTFTVGPAKPGTLDHMMAAAQLDLAILPLLSLPRGEVFDWFQTPRKTRSVGAAYELGDDNGWFEGLKLTQVFDALIFVRNTSAARPNPSSYQFFTRTIDAPQNLDFERGKIGELPPEWETQPAALRGFDYEIKLTKIAQNGKQSVHISRNPGKRYGNYYAGVQQKLKADHYRDKDLCVSANARLDRNSEQDIAHLWLRINPKGFGGSSTYYVSVTKPEWTSYSIRGPVRSDSVGIEYGFLFYGEGNAFVDHFKVGACE